MDFIIFSPFHKVSLFLLCAETKQFCSATIFTSHQMFIDTSGANMIYYNSSFLFYHDYYTIHSIPCKPFNTQIRWIFFRCLHFSSLFIPHLHLPQPVYLLPRITRSILPEFSIQQCFCWGSRELIRSCRTAVNTIWNQTLSCSCFRSIFMEVPIPLLINNPISGVIFICRCRWSVPPTLQ